MQELKLIASHKSFIVPPKFNLTSDERLILLKKSNCQLEEHLDKFVKKISHLENGHHLWATTYRPLRFDDLEDLALYYFSIQILEFFQTNYPEHKIIISGNMDDYYRDFLETKFPKIKILEVSMKSSLKRRVSQQLSPLIYFKNVFYSLIRNSNRQNQDKGQIWMSVPADSKKHRYRHLLDHISLGKSKYPNNLTERKNYIKSENSVNFLNYVNVKNVLKTFKESLEIKIHIWKIKPQSLLEFHLKSNNIFHIWNMVLKEQTIKSAIRQLQPKLILYTTALTHPPARMVARQAYLHKIPFIVVACRPMFTELRMEERLTKSDLEKKNEAHVADAYIVWDKLSKHTLLQQGIPENEIFVAQPKHAPQEIKKIYKSSLLVLLSHEQILNDKLIDSVFAIKEHLNLNIIIREHPARRITDFQKEKLLNIDAGYLDCTRNRLNELVFENCLAITINSTVGIEAVERGCALIWLPYLNERALIFKSVMEKLGFEAKNPNDFEKYLKEVREFGVLQKWIVECKNSFQDHFEHNDETESFIQKFNLN